MKLEQFGAVWSSLNNRREQSKPKAKGMSEMRDGYSNVDGHVGCAELGVGQLL